jgi:O-antigen ligase
MYLTFSRGGWVALGVGLVALVAIAPRRLHLLALLLAIAPWPALAVVAASRADALTTDGSTLAAATDDGRVLLVYVATLTVAAGLVGGLFAAEERRVEVGRAGRFAFAAVLVVTALVGAGWVWSEHGSPWSLADRAWDDFHSGPDRSGDELSGRLFDLSSNGRLELWGVAWDDFRAAPLAGNGAGSFEQSFYRERESTQVARDGHSLYAETLGELGVVGMALLGACLLVPLVAVLRVRRDVLLVGTAAAYVAFLAHAAVDWDWELAGVTIVALLLGCALVASARPDEVATEPRPSVRLAGAGAAALLAALALWSLLATVPLGRAREALLRGDFATAVEEAEDAERWAPWSAKPWQYRGDGLLAQGRVAEARRSYGTAVEKELGEWLLWLDLAVTSSGEAQRRALARAAALNPNEEQIRIVQDAVRNPAGGE